MWAIVLNKVFSKIQNILIVVPKLKLLIPPCLLLVRGGSGSRDPTANALPHTPVELPRSMCPSPPDRLLYRK